MFDELSSESELKKAFAVFLLKTPNEPFKAALEVFPEDTSRALWAANNWPYDSEVKVEVERLKDSEGEMAFLPSKADFLRKLWDRMDGTTLANGTIVPTNPDEFAKIAKLYAEVRGFVEKPQNTNNLNVFVPKAIEVPVFKSDEDWEVEAARQQQALLAVSRSKQ